jgi:hypothetical protein
MTTKRELERLARKALGPGSVDEYWESIEETCASGVAGFVSVGLFADVTRKERREMLAAALRGIIAWKEGEK